ncbi:MAG: 50S ribosomal protein L30 [Firmicutes bacterium]|nr:50S ribosomal protein L30 [Bacillota bacterium]MCL2770811.1 50S ribosomal protein L30 [Bacillota bacterium]
MRITLVRSTICCTPKQRATIQALGLKRPGNTRLMPDNAASRGQVHVVRHMIKVEEVK